MKDLFSDIPQSIKNINDLIKKITPFDLSNEVQLPKFQIPKEFNNNSENGSGENEYLKYLTFQGAKKRYGKVSDELNERIEFELETIKNIGLNYSIIIENVTEYYKNQNRIKISENNSSFCNSSNDYLTPENYIVKDAEEFGGFYTYDEMLDQLDLMHSLYPNLISEIQEIKDDNEPIFISAFLGDNPDQALATSVYSKVVGTSSENNEIKLDVDGYGLINASEAVRFRN